MTNFNKILETASILKVTKEPSDLLYENKIWRCVDLGPAGPCWMYRDIFNYKIMRVPTGYMCYYTNTGKDADLRMMAVRDTLDEAQRYCEKGDHE